MAPKRGIDALFTQAGKSLPTGGSLSFRLVKGPPTIATADPVDPKAPPQEFPLMAKFPESVVRPDFTKHPWNTGRLYQQEVPRPVEDDDDDNNEDAAHQQKKKRWKYNRNHAAQRQWILQEEVDFLETMVAKREKRETKKLSSRYEGVPEHNASQYVIFFASENNTYSNHHPYTGDEQPTALLQVRTLPSPLGTIPFAQPAVRHSYSLSQAENVIQDQRMGIRTLRPDESSSNEPVLRIRKAEANSKSRLMEKLKAKSASDDVEEGDDIMGDVAYRNRKSGGARRELLQDIGEGVLVSEEGVLGGANDAVFGGKQRFGELKAEKLAVDDAAPGNADNTERGADGAAMADDFYTRDVKAEYDELDYDANEQFDDDDVDLGESEMAADTGGFGGDEDDEDELDEEEDEETTVAGAEGLASAAGFKMMLAKARGELPQLVTAADLRSDAANSRGDKDAGVDADDHISKIMKAAEKAAAEAGQKKIQEPQSATSAPAAPAAASIQVDENGFRIISLDAVRREIWLNHGQIPMKRLMKIFDIKKKSTADRQAKFREMVKELCTMVNDPVAGRMLVLKQHYSNMK